MTPRTESMLARIHSQEHESESADTGANTTPELTIPQRYLQHDLPETIRRLGSSREFIRKPQATVVFEALCRFGYRDLLRELLRTNLESTSIVGLTPSVSEETQRRQAAKGTVLDQVIPGWKELI